MREAKGSENEGKGGGGMRGEGGGGVFALDKRHLSIPREHRSQERIVLPPRQVRHVPVVDLLLSLPRGLLHRRRRRLPQEQLRRRRHVAGQTLRLRARGRRAALSQRRTHQLLHPLREPGCAQQRKPRRGVHAGAVRGAVVVRRRVLVLLVTAVAATAAAAADRRGRSGGRVFVVAAVCRVVFVGCVEGQVVRDKHVYCFVLIRVRIRIRVRVHIRSTRTCRLRLHVCVDVHTLLLPCPSCVVVFVAAAAGVACRSLAVDVRLVFAVQVHRRVRRRGGGGSGGRGCRRRGRRRHVCVGDGAVDVEGCTGGCDVVGDVDVHGFGGGEVEGGRGGG
eukprot:Rhum_TRINITY_DN14766_c20_g1::Rhum_TRINITY_DN14766_c20_g1_i1::g.115136::m.115136